MRLLAALAILAGAAGAETIKVGASLTPQPLAIGDRAALTAVFTTSPGIRLEPAFSATALGEWEVLGVRALPPRPAGAEIEQRFEVILTCWSATATASPELAFAASIPPASPHRIVVAPIPVTMRSALAGVKDADDLKAPKGMIEYRSWWPWILAGLALALAGAGAWLWRRRVKALAAASGVPALPPEISAHEALERLLASNLLEEGQVKGFYSELSDVLRRYLEGRFGIPALDRTTTELLPELRQRAELRALFGELRAFLDDGDLVKFARYVPEPAEIDADVNRVRRVIAETTPRQAPAAVPEPVR